MLGDNLREYRQRAGLTQAEAASKVHVVRQTLSKWEMGRSVPDADLLLKLADLYNTDAAVLLDTKLPEEGDRKEYQQMILDSLSSINDQLSARERRVKRIFHAVMLSGAAILLWGVIQGSAGFCGFQRLAGDYTLGDTNANMLLTSYVHAFQEGIMKGAAGAAILLITYLIGRE